MGTFIIIIINLGRKSKGQKMERNLEAVLKPCMVLYDWIGISTRCSLTKAQAETKCPTPTPHSFNILLLLLGFNQQLPSVIILVHSPEQDSLSLIYPNFIF